MKTTKLTSRILAALLAALAVISITACGSKKKSADTQTTDTAAAGLADLDEDFFGKYTFTGTDAAYTSEIVLNENGGFQFTFSQKSDYKAHGTYTVKDGVVTLTTDDNKYHYTFKLQDGVLVFDEKNSSKERFKAQFVDGSVFE